MNILSILIQLHSEGTPSPKSELGRKSQAFKTPLKDSRIQTTLIFRKLLFFQKSGPRTEKACILGPIKWYVLKTAPGAFTFVGSYWTNSGIHVVHVLHLPFLIYYTYKLFLVLGLRVKWYVVDFWFNGLQDSGLWIWLICKSAYLNFNLNFRQADFSPNSEPSQLFGKSVFVAFFQRIFPVICKVYFLMYILFEKSQLMVNSTVNGNFKPFEVMHISLPHVCSAEGAVYCLK